MNISGNQAIAADAASVGPAQRESAGQRHLFGPVTDFLCLGGVSLLLLPVMFLLPEKELSATVAAIAMGIAHFINHPHFAFSYQIFYKGFRQKAFGPVSDSPLRSRYVFAGIVVPASLVLFLAYSMAFGDDRMLGYGANLMGFLVGWHYVKQGYGMLMVDAALKRRYFDAADKKVLLANSYAVWALTWLLANSVIKERALWGIDYYAFEIPSLVLNAAFCVAVATTVMTLSVLIKKWRSGNGLPVSGVVAYFVSLYLWVLFVRMNALWLLLVPALHSLQYLLVVARYRVNQEKNRPDGAEPPEADLYRRVFRRRYLQRCAGFVFVGLLLGYVGFWAAPQILQPLVPYDQAVFGGTALLFVFWVFINVHHYFLDNVMWRSENPDVRKHLFA